MPTLEIRTLHHNDAPHLLAFELRNRAWFERHVEAREPAFYTPDGVREHIANYLEGYARGCWHPCLAFDASGAVVGRANLKDIDAHTRSAEVGYRIGQDQAGHGIATQLLEHLVTIARTQWDLASLTAEVTVHNAASARVLEKCGFVRQRPLTRVAMVGGAWVDGVEYRCELVAT
jgi:ribosomal-protein-alanine N-acetyltransferase